MKVGKSARQTRHKVPEFIVPVMRMVVLESMISKLAALKDDVNAQQSLMQEQKRRCQYICEVCRNQDVSFILLRATW